MKHNLHKNAYLVSDNTIPALQKIFKTEWEPLGYKIATGKTDIKHITQRGKFTGKYLHAVGYRMYFDNKDYVQKTKILIDDPNPLMNVE